MQKFLRVRTLAGLSIVSLLFTGCVASSSGQGGAETRQVAELEERLAKNEDILTDLTHRISVMQFMVDDHENMLRLGEKPGTVKTAAAPPQATAPATQTPVAKPRVAPAKTSTATRVSDIKEAPAAAKSGKPAAAPDRPSDTNPSQLYNYAFATLQNKDYDKASRLFRELADSYPNHSLANNALYWQGECYYAKGDMRAAILVFEELAERYPKGVKVPDSLLKRAYAYISLGDTAKARDILSLLLREYPDTPAAAKADARLKSLS